LTEFAVLQENKKSSFSREKQGSQLKTKQIINDCLRLTIADKGIWVFWRLTGLLRFFFMFLAMVSEYFVNTSF